MNRKWPEDVKREIINTHPKDLEFLSKKYDIQLHQLRIYRYQWRLANPSWITGRSTTEEKKANVQHGSWGNQAFKLQAMKKKEVFRPARDEYMEKVRNELVEPEPEMIDCMLCFSVKVTKQEEFCEPCKGAMKQNV